MEIAHPNCEPETRFTEQAGLSIVECSHWCRKEDEIHSRKRETMETEGVKKPGGPSWRTTVFFTCFFSMIVLYVIYLLPSGFSEQKKAITMKDLNTTLPSFPDDLAIIGNFTVHWTSGSLVPRRITKLEYAIMIELLRLTDEVFRRWNITYFMAGGTLIGSYFHHDIVPWDDDLDLIAEYNKKQDIIAAFQSIGGKYGVAVTKNKLCVKLYRTDGRHLGYPWKWPFVDVFLYHTNDTHWWEMDMADIHIPVYEVFPLSLRPFGPLWLPAPHNAELNIVKTERMKTTERKCESNRYNHLIEEWITSYTVPCDELMKSYPFVVDRQSVQISNNSAIFVETVRIGDEIVQEIVIPGQ